MIAGFLHRNPALEAGRLSHHSWMGLVRCWGFDGSNPLVEVADGVDECWKKRGKNWENWNQ